MKITKPMAIIFTAIFFVMMIIISIHNGVNILLGVAVGACVYIGILLFLWCLDVFIIKNNGIYIRGVDDEEYSDDGWDSPFIN